MDTDSPTPRTGRVLFAMCLSLMLVIATMASLNLALPDLAVRLNASVTDLTWIADAYTVALAATVLPFGAVGDRIGRRTVLAAGLIVFGVAAAIAALQTSADGVIVCRAVMGLGAAMIMPGTLATITATFPPERRSRGVAVWTGVAGAGAIVGLLAAGCLLTYWNWESVFWMSAGVAVLALVAAITLTPNTRDDHHPGLDVVGSAVSAIAIGALVFGIISGGEHGWTSQRAVISFSVSAMAFVVFGFVELRHPAPMLDVRVFRHRWFSIGSLAVTAQFLAWLGYIFINVQYLQLILGYSPLKTSLAAVPVGMVVMPMAQVAPRLVDRFGSRTVVVAGLTLLAAGSWVQSTLTVDHGYLRFLMGFLVMGVGVAWTATPATTAITAALPRAKQGVASAMNDTTREVGAALGIAIVGTVFGTAYRSAIEPALESIPPQGAEIVRESPAAALHMSDRFGERGAAMADQVRHAFMDGAQDAMLTVAFIAAAVAIVTLIVAPSRADDLP